MKKCGFLPVLDEHTEVLILGSLPSDESIRKQQYYGNPGNDFWRLLGKAIREDLVSSGYEERIRILRKHHIGLWDVFRAGERTGSLDSEIRGTPSPPEVNDFSKLKNLAPGLRLICFNGKMAGKYAPFLKELGYETKILPSSSGANRRFSEKRAEEWASVFKAWRF
ncbi:MAG: DNA-deoxyinosine glycosylase [Methanosarcinaceae archaeon]|nr:DNA-deoxyinosine glycosylase [Methanosarcinaceae archaeon]